MLPFRCSSTELYELAAGNFTEVVREGVSVFANSTAIWYPSNQNNAQATCEHCSGVIRHERWCITRSPLVRYAYGVVLDAEKLAFADRLILHALGVTWGAGDATAAAGKRTVSGLQPVR